MKVLITKCSKPGSWYKDKINQSFEVKQEGDRFILSEDFYKPNKNVHRYIEKGDCEVITNDQSPQRTLL